MTVTVGIVVGFIAWFFVRCLVAGLFTVNQNERAVKTRFAAPRGRPASPRWTIPSQTYSTKTRKGDTSIRRFA
jgi:hypothetical protein